MERAQKGQKAVRFIKNIVHIFIAILLGVGALFVSVVLVIGVLIFCAETIRKFASPEVMKIAASLFSLGVASFVAGYYAGKCGWAYGVGFAIALPCCVYWGLTRSGAAPAGFLWPANLSFFITAALLFTVGPLAGVIGQRVRMRRELRRRKGLQERLRKRLTKLLRGPLPALCVGLGLIAFLSFKIFQFGSLFTTVMRFMGLQRFFSFDMLMSVVFALFLGLGIWVVAKFMTLQKKWCRALEVMVWIYIGFGIVFTIYNYISVRQFAAEHNSAGFAVDSLWFWFLRFRTTLIAILCSICLIGFLRSHYLRRLQLRVISRPDQSPIGLVRDIVDWLRPPGTILWRAVVRRKVYWLVGGGLAMVCAAVFFIEPLRLAVLSRMTRGELVLFRSSTPATGNHAVQEDLLNRDLDLIKARIHKYGEVKRIGKTWFLVSLFGSGRPTSAQIQSLISRECPGFVEFRLVEDNVSDVSQVDPGKVELLKDRRGRTMAVARESLMAGAMFSDVQRSTDETGNHCINMTFDRRSKRRFQAVTKANVGRRLAIVYEGEVKTAPEILTEIKGGYAQITGHFSQEEADALTELLGCGVLANSYEVVLTEPVGPTLLKDPTQAGVVTRLMIAHIENGRDVTRELNALLNHSDAAVRSNAQVALEAATPL